MKKIVTISCLFILCLGIGLALLPTFLSTSWGKSTLLAIVNKTSDANLSIDKLQLSWSQGQIIDNLNYQDKYSQIHIQKINTNASLTKLILYYLKDTLLLLESQTEIIEGKYTFIPENEEGENKLNPITLSHINAKWHYPTEENLEETKSYPVFTASGITKQGELQGRFEVDALIKGQHPKQLISQFIKMAEGDASKLNIPKNTELKLNAKLLDVPVLAIERSFDHRHPEWKGALKDTLGDILSLSLKYEVNTNSQDYHLQLKAPKSEVDIKGTIADNIVLIDQGSYSHFTLTPKVFNLLCPIQKLELTQASTIQINLEKGSIPFDTTQESINFLDATIQGNIHTPKLTFNDKGILNQFNLNDFDLEFNGSLNNGLKILHKYKLQLLKPSVWSELLGSTLNISMHGRLLLSDQKLNSNVLPIPLKVDPFVLSINSSEIQLSLQGKMNDHNQIELTAPIAVRYEGSQKAFDWLKKEKQLNFSTQIGSIDLTMEPIVIDLGKDLKNTLSKINLQGQLTTDHLNIRYPKNAKDELPISDLAIQWAFKGNERRAQLQFKANHGPSESLEGNVALVYDGDAFIQAKDHISGITWLISPNRFAILRQMVHDYLHAEESINDLSQKKMAYVPHPSKLLSDIVLKENFPLDITINALRIPLKKGQQSDIETFPLDFANSSLQMRIGANQLAFFEREQKKSWSFDTFSMNINSSSIKDGFQFDMKLKESPLAGQKKPLSTLDVAGKLNNVFDPDKLNLQITVQGRQTPVPFLTQCSCAVKGMEKQIEAILGQRVDMDVYGAFYPRKQSGNINAKLKGLQGSLILDGYITDGMLYLNAPLSAELTVTPQLSQTFLDAVMPILNSAVSNTQPITIGIDHRGFAMPLDLSRKDKISIPMAAIDLGQMEFSPHGQLGQVLSFLDPKKEQQQQYSAPKSHNIWFTPLYFSIANQIIRCERMDLLADNRYPLAIWGKVNLAKDEVNMKIALTAEALRQMLDAKEIPNSAILLLPLKGTMSNASIDKSKAMKEIAPLLAHSRGGPEGLIIGTVLELLNGGSKKKKVPEPTTQPLPWTR